MDPRDAQPLLWMAQHVDNHTKVTKGPHKKHSKQEDNEEHVPRTRVHVAEPCSIPYLQEAENRDIWCWVIEDNLCSDHHWQLQRPQLWFAKHTTNITADSSPQTTNAL